MPRVEINLESVTKLRNRLNESPIAADQDQLLGATREEDLLQSQQTQTVINPRRLQRAFLREQRHPPDAEASTDIQMVGHAFLADLDFAQVVNESKILALQSIGVLLEMAGDGRHRFTVIVASQMQEPRRIGGRRSTIVPYDNRGHGI